MGANRAFPIDLCGANLIASPNIPWPYKAPVQTWYPSNATRGKKRNPHQIPGRRSLAREYANRSGTREMPKYLLKADAAMRQLEANSVFLSPESIPFIQNRIPQTHNASINRSEERRVGK